MSIPTRKEKDELIESMDECFTGDSSDTLRGLIEANIGKSLTKETMTAAITGAAIILQALNLGMDSKKKKATIEEAFIIGGKLLSDMMKLEKTL